MRGNHISSVEILHIRQLSKSIADLHQLLCQSVKNLPFHPRNLEWALTRSKKLDPHLTRDQKALLHTSLKRVKTLTYTLETANVTKSLIHADLFRDNVLFENENISGLLAFHHASIGYCIYDLAVIAIDWCRTK